MTFSRRALREFERQEREGWPAWGEAQSIDDLGALVVRWLDGHDLVLPSHLAPPDPETSEIAQDLRALNLMGGVVTDGSQPGQSDFLGRQRAFVHGVATPTAAAVLRQRAHGAEMCWAESPALGTSSGRSDALVPVTQGVLRGVGPTRTKLYPLSGGDLPFLRRIPNIPREEQETWLSFAVVDPVWGRKRALWGALLGGATDTPTGRGGAG